MFQPKVVEEVKTHFVVKKILARKSCRFGDNVEKYCRAEQPTEDNIAHAHCMLNT
jgi:hypothetical protein